MENAMSSATPESLELSGTDFIETVVRAGAGAGKTRALVQRVLKIYNVITKSHGRRPRLVVCTFTRKATQELRQRLVNEALNQQDSDFLEFVQDESRLHISTIHGVLVSFLRDHGHLMGIGKDLTLVESHRSKKTLLKIIRQVLRSHLELGQVLEYLSIQQVAEFCIKFHGLTLQGRQPQVPSMESTRSFVESLISEIRGRGNSLLNSWREQPLRSTSAEKSKEWEAWAKWIKGLEEFLAQLTWEGLCGASNGASLVALLPRKPSFRSDKSLLDPEFNESVVSFLASTKQLESDAFSFKHWERVATAHSFLLAIAQKVHPLFVEAKVTAGEFSFDDLESFSLALIRAHPVAAERFSKNWDQWLIDEFQDTSPAQLELIEKLKGQSPSFFVGDPQQSIYLFRGARVEVFDSKEAEVARRGGAVSQLATNFRSKPELVGFFNWTFSKLSSGPNPFRPMRARSEEDSEAEGKVTVALAENEEEHFEWVRLRIGALMARGASLQQICILGRTNGQLEALASYLKRAGLPCLLHTSGGFSARREVMDALSFALFLKDPGDDFNLIRLLRSPWFRVPDSVLARLRSEMSQNKSDKSFWSKLSTCESLLMLDQTQVELVVANLKQYLDMAVQAGWVSAFERGLMDTGLIHSSTYHDGTGQREANLWKLVVMFRRLEREKLLDALTWIRNLLSGDEASLSDAVVATAPDRLNLMTVHLAKGLEFDHVILPFCHKAPQLTRYRTLLHDETNNFLMAAVLDLVSQKSPLPIQSRACIADLNQREAAESIRVLYVALTRAKESLHLLGEKKFSRESWLGLESWRAFTLRDPNDQPAVVLDSDPKCVVHVDQPKDSGALSPKAGLRVESLRAKWRDVPAPRAVAQTAEVGHGVHIGHATPAVSPAQAAQIALRQFRSAVRGEQFHRTMQTLRYKDRFILDEESERAIKFLEEQQEFPWMELIEMGHVEYAYSRKVEGKLLQRRVDLWGVYAGSLWVVDYKTGSSLSIDSAQEQVLRYAKDLLELEEVKHQGVRKGYAVVVYPHELKIWKGTVHT